MKFFNKTTKLILSTIALFVLIIYSFQLNKEQANFKPYDVVFQSPKGDISLSKFKGKLVIMYFGFLSCPEACPTTLNRVGSVFKQLPKDELDKIEMIFIDLDPERDTLPKMSDYTSFFHPKILPFTTDMRSLRLFSRYFGVEFRKVELKSNMGYTIDHSTDMIVISPDGKLLPNIHHETDSKLLLLVIKQLIKENFN